MGMFVFVYTYVYTHICMQTHTPARVTALGMGMEEDEGVEHAVGGEHLAHPLACRQRPSRHVCDKFWEVSAEIGFRV
jgi:hypothetical protein